MAHAPRQAGRSAYSLYRLIRLNFDLMTGFSIVPLQAFGFFGTLVALGGIAFGVFLFVRRLIVGAEVEGVFTLFAILFTLLGIAMAGLGHRRRVRRPHLPAGARAGRASASGASTAWRAETPRPEAPRAREVSVAR